MNLLKHLCCFCRRYRYLWPALFHLHYIKYARIWIFTDLYPPVYGQNRRFCPYTGEYGPVKARIFAYFMQCYGRPLSFITLEEHK